MKEIDGIRLALGSPATEAGDYISDEYYTLIDLTTSTVNAAKALRIASSVRRLNRNLATTSIYLSGTDLAEVYDDVVGQINHLNDGLNVGQLLPLITDESRFAEYSGSFKWATA
jgi:hypothetical protein